MEMINTQYLKTKNGLRLCKVNKELGYFHYWEQYANATDSEGQYSRVFGIIEFDDRIERIDPSKIQFIDDTHNFLYNLKKYLDSFEKVEK